MQLCVSYLPVCLCILLPHDSIELIIVLVTEDESDIIVINLCIDKESSLEVDAAKPVEAHGQTRIRVHGLYNLSSLKNRKLKIYIHLVIKTFPLVIKQLR